MVEGKVGAMNVGIRTLNERDIDEVAEGSDQRTRGDGSFEEIKQRWLTMYVFVCFFVLHKVLIPLVYVSFEKRRIQRFCLCDSISSGARYCISNA